MTLSPQSRNPSLKPGLLPQGNRSKITTEKKDEELRKQELRKNFLRKSQIIGQGLLKASLLQIIQRQKMRAQSRQL